jgi:hypothetical protein
VCEGRVGHYAGARVTRSDVSVQQTTGVWLRLLNDTSRRATRARRTTRFNTTPPEPRVCPVRDTLSSLCLAPGLHQSQ